MIKLLEKPRPIITLIIEVMINVIKLTSNIFPILLGLFIFPIDVVMVKNISGTIITNKVFKNKSPNGFKLLDFSLNIKPIIIPIIIDVKSMIDDL